MKIHFNNLIIHNFLSFGHAEVNLQDCGYVLISGVNNNPKDTAKSNGSGKSTIFNALSYALTGETIQGLSTNLNNMFTDGDMYVTLDFSVDNDHYVITRSRDRNNKANLKVVVNDVDKSGKGIRESEVVLSQCLPDITSELVGEVILIGQGMPHKFSANTPSGRKELLEKLSHSDFMLEDIKSRIETRLNELKTKKSEIDNEQTRLTTKKEYCQKELDNLNNKLNSLDDNKLKQDLNNLSPSIKTLEEDITKIQEEKTYKENSLSVNTEALQNSLKLLQEELQEEEKTFNEFNLNVSKEITEKETQIRSLNSEIIRLQNIKDVCPTCGQKLPNVHKPDTTEQVKEKQKLEESLVILKDKDSKQKEAFRLNKEDINKKYASTLDNLRQHESTLKADITQLESNLRSKESNYNALKVQKAQLEKELELFEQNKQNILKDIENRKTEQQDLESKILYNISESNKLDEHLGVVTKMSTLTKRDFRGILLSNIIVYLDKKCKQYCSDIFRTVDLDFVLEGNNINISYCKKPLEALSGGEKQKVDLIVQFAIRDMMQEYTGFSSNILVLDEILDNLDSIGSDQVLNFINSKLSDTESIFIISHHSDSLNICCDSELRVVKNQEGVSSIV